MRARVDWSSHLEAHVNAGSATVVAVVEVVGVVGVVEVVDMAADVEVVDVVGSVGTLAGGAVDAHAVSRTSDTANSLACGLMRHVGPGAGLPTRGEGPV